MSNNMKIISMVAVVAALGGGVLFWQKNRTAETPVPQAASSVAPTPEATPDQATSSPSSMPTAEAGQIVPNAPEMPITATSPGSAPSEKPVIAGTQIGGAFSLVDHKGNAVTEKSWPGKYKLVFFGFARCTDICPATLQKISTVMENYDPRSVKIQPLFITTDPAHDTQNILSVYIGGYNQNILGLTGTKEQVAQAVQSYKVYASESESGTPDHSSYVYLMSEDDKPLEIMRASLSVEEMTEKIKSHVEHVDAVAPTAAPAAH